MAYDVRKPSTFTAFVILLLFGMLQPVLAYPPVSGNATAQKAATNDTATATSRSNTVMGSSPKNTCPCVVFRLDNIRGSHLSDVQTKIMDEFQKKNASLTIGVIGSNLVSDGKLVSYLKDHLKSGHSTIEIANHGWTHDNFATETLSQQVSLLNATNHELQKVLGKTPSVFAVPYGMYDNDTLKAMHKLKMDVISSDIWSEDKFVKNNGMVVPNRDSFGIYHVPSMTDFQVDVGDESYWTLMPRDKLLTGIDAHVFKYGYDVVLLYPQNFAKLVNGTYTDVVDTSSIDDLSYVLDYVKSKNIKITTLADVAGLEHVTTPVAGASEKHPVSKPADTSVSMVASQHVSEPTESGPVSRVATHVEPNGTLTVDLKHSDGNRIGTRGVSLQIYRDFDRTPCMEIPSISDNPYTVGPLTMYHQYKIKTYIGGMLSSTNLVTLDDADQNLDVNIPDAGTLLVSVYYKDGKTLIPDATLSVKSQDNKTRVTGITDSEGSSYRFYLPPTIMRGNYYVVDAKINNHLTYSSTPVMVQSGDVNDVQLITPWPSVVQDLVTVHVYNQTRLLSSIKQTLAVYMYDGKGEKVSESPINIHGEAYFWSMKVGDYVFKVVDTVNGRILQSTNVTIDGGDQNDFSIVIPKNTSTKGSPDKI